MAYITFTGCILLVLSLVNLDVVVAKKILMLAPSVGSHLMQMNSIAEGLLDQGHDVYTILNSRAKVSEDILNRRIKVIEYDTGSRPVFETKDYQDAVLAPELENLSFFGKFQPMGKLFELVVSDCTSTLSNVVLYKRLQKEQFDFAVVDALLRCFALLPYKLNVPFASFMSFMPMDIPHAALQCPILLHTPMNDIVASETTPPLVVKLLKVTFLTFFFGSMEVFGDYADTTIFEVQKQSKLWLYDVSQVMDTPMPVSPNVINVGGLNVRKASPLPEGELKHFVDSANDGFIFLSFGSIAKLIPDRIVRVLLDTFRAVPYKIVWKWDKKTLKPDMTVPSNVLPQNWVPQNDILGHKNIKLFVTHCGNSGQHEGLFHGVPMLGIPLFADQPFNCKRMEGRYGRHIRVRDLTTDKLVKLVKEIIHDRKYSDNIKKASAIFRDQPMEPRETAAYWIDHVIKYGADHLQSKTNDMSWIQILMFDVLFVVCVAGFVFMLVCFLICRCLYRRCCRQREHREKVKRS